MTEQMTEQTEQTIAIKELPFSLVQNWNNEFPQFDPYQVIVYGQHQSSYDSCDYNGKMRDGSTFSNEVPKSFWFALADDEDTRNAWVGETKEEGGLIFGKVWWK